MSGPSRPGPAETDRYHLDVRVLFVCTANICRSPMAAALFAAHARLRNATPEVSSAGTDAGRPSIPDTVPPEVTEVMARRGIDLGGHRGRELTRSALLDTDLVIGMGRRHVRESVVLDPTCFTRAFTLTELVERGRSSAPGRPARRSDPGSRRPRGTGPARRSAGARTSTTSLIPMAVRWPATGPPPPSWTS